MSPVRLILVCLIAGLFGRCLADASAEDSAEATNPQVSCSVLNALNNAQNSHTNAFPVGNLDQVALQIRVNGGNLRLPLNERVLTNSLIAECGTNQACVLLSVKSMTNGVESAVPVKVFPTGMGQHFNQLTFSVSIEIPSDDRRKAKDVEEVLERAEADEVDSQTRQALQASRESIRTMLMNQYTDQATGRYQITCTYFCRVPGFWNGEVVSAPISIEVVINGSLADKLGARFKKTATGP